MGVEERTSEEDGSVLPTLSINTSGHGTNLEKIFVGRKQKKKKKDLKRFSVYTEYVSNFPRGEMKYVRGSQCEWVWVLGSECSVPQP